MNEEERTPTGWIIACVASIAQNARMESDPMTNPPVLIVGAGPTGLVLALWLTRCGVAVRIIDRAREPGTTSRALALQIRTLEFYRQLGIADAIIENGVKITALNFWTKGRRVTQVPFQTIGEGRTPYPFVFILPQDVHERLLIERLSQLGVHLERGTELISLEQNDHRVRATLMCKDGFRKICEPAYLAGCDGASSTVRQHLNIGFPGGTYAGLFYVADVEATGPANDGNLHIDLEDADFVLVFPMKGGGRVRLVGAVRDLHQNGGSLRFDDVRGRAIENLKLNVSRMNWFSTYRVHHRVAARFRDGRTFLLGDAAHIHSPVGGQGMNTGIGDAVNLAWKLAAVLKGTAASDLLDTYESERIPFARRLVATTDQAFVFVTKRSTTARFIRTKVIPRAAPFLLNRAPIRNFLFRTISQTGISYHDSTLSVGKNGSVAGGDRLPWVLGASGGDNFAALESLDWQVHVYGKAGVGTVDFCAQVGLPLNVFPWNAESQGAGIERDALYLIRPDGHVALADSAAKPARLKTYSERHALSFR
ncbi:MAG TPA: FAD-dependent monooxygenase [Gemmatimonadaceae bacterium]|nr:FAD-dependent monooxygenase [Gemmatimonadaceae bacterium]